MTSICMKRIARERARFPSDSPEFFVAWHDDNLLAFDAYIVGPQDSLYRHKLIKLRFELPDSYPLKPPKVQFVQFAGERIHPNLYVEGKVCLSILGTWPGPGWSTGMTIESVLVTIRSLLDMSPYQHEPNQRDNPAFNAYVQYHGWRWLLLDYVGRERDEEGKAFLERHLRVHGAAMVAELEVARKEGRGGGRSPYVRGGGGGGVDWAGLIKAVKGVLPGPEAPPVVLGGALPVLGGGFAAQEGGLKRKLPVESEGYGAPTGAKGSMATTAAVRSSASTATAPPAKKQHKPAPEVIDLTDD